ncbi:hypothetical protein KM043_005688 [Ampulex compressa]|nr:hypothetical protein KM043_005688 [Ampulex compressa]
MTMIMYRAEGPPRRELLALLPPIEIARSIFSEIIGWRRSEITRREANGETSKPPRDTYPSRQDEDFRRADRPASGLLAGLALVSGATAMTDGGHSSMFKTKNQGGVNLDGP